MFGVMTILSQQAITQTLSRIELKFKEEVMPVCVDCKRVVLTKNYKGQEPYRCAKCRGIEIPKKKKVKLSVEYL